VVLDSAKIFDIPAGTRVRADLKGPAAKLLSLVKAFPDHRVVLDGYAGSGATAAERANLSSAQAWALYSYLVRSGVPATRVEVHGRGGRRGTGNHIDVRLLAPTAAAPIAP